MMKAGRLTLPNDAELDHALGHLDDLEGLLVLGVLLEERRQRELDLVEGLSGSNSSSESIPRQLARTRETEEDWKGFLLPAQTLAQREG